MSCLVGLSDLRRRNPEHAATACHSTRVRSTLVHLILIKISVRFVSVRVFLSLRIRGSVLLPGHVEGLQSYVGKALAAQLPHRARTVRMTSLPGLVRLSFVVVVPLPTSCHLSAGCSYAAV